VRLLRRQKAAPLVDVVAVCDATILVGLLLADERLFQEEHALENRQKNANSSDEVGEEVWVSSEDAILGEEVGVELGRLC
jgi:hypothetical protein